MAAQALLDPGAMPSWLGGPNGAAPQIGGRGGAGGEASGRAANMGMQAGSLVDENSLPQWLRNEPATASPSQRVPAVAPGSVSQWITGAADEPLPTWLNQVYADVPSTAQPARAPQTPYMPAQPSAGYAPQASPYGSADAAGATAGGMAAGQFVDESALPDWLKAQGATPQPAYPATPQPGYLAPQQSPQSPQGYAPGYGQAPYQPTPYQAAPPSTPLRVGPDVFPGAASGMFAPQASQQFPQAEPGPTFSASDLIDPDALPSWVGGGQEKGGATNQRANSPQSAGSRQLGGMDGWDDDGANPAAGMNDQIGASATRRAAATLGQATSRQPRPPMPQGSGVNSQPGQRGQSGAPSGALGGANDGWDDGWDAAPAAAPPPYTQRQSAQAGRPGRPRPDDANGWNANAPAQAGRPQTPPAGRPLPPVQRGQPTGGLGQGAPLQRDELPAWLRAGSPHGQANGAAQGYGAPPPPQPEPAYDEWGLPIDDWGAEGANDGAVGYADGYGNPGYDGGYDPRYAEQAPYGGNSAAGRGQGRPAGGARGASSQPDQQEKRGWRRIFGRR
jgi:hypothetical protein